MYIMTSRGCGVLTLERYDIFLLNVILYVSRHEEFDSTIIDMKKCKKNQDGNHKYATNGCRLCEKDYISCSANKKHKNMTK